MTTVLDQQVRNGAFDSASVPVPAGVASLVVQSTMSDVDAQNPANSCRILARASWDGGQTYAPFGAPYDWQGGIGPRGNFTVPSESLPLPADGGGNPPTNVMVTLDTLGNALNTGIALDFS